MSVGCGYFPFEITLRERSGERGYVRVQTESQGDGGDILLLDAECVRFGKHTHRQACEVLVRPAFLSHCHVTESTEISPAVGPNCMGSAGVRLPSLGLRPLFEQQAQRLLFTLPHKCVISPTCRRLAAWPDTG